MTGNIRVEFISADTGVDLIEIRRVGDPDTVLYKVSEKIEWLRENFPRETEAYEKSGSNKSAAKVKPIGTELTELKGIGSRKAKHLISQDVSTVEQLSELSDASVGGLGAGTVDLRKLAREYLAEKSGNKPKQVVG